MTGLPASISGHCSSSCGALLFGDSTRVTGCAGEEGGRGVPGDCSPEGMSRQKSCGDIEQMCDAAASARARAMPDSPKFVTAWSESALMRFSQPWMPGILACRKTHTTSGNSVSASMSTFLLRGAGAALPFSGLAPAAAFFDVPREASVMLVTRVCPGDGSAESTALTTATAALASAAGSRGAMSGEGRGFMARAWKVYVCEGDSPKTT
mmetsp:Transcript_11334/g.22818  ORF Transcript_11334/g.22818 Transcript_11334/m.22818 type:complete len:209 (+) Transcript_11334:450-1076(+)